MSEVIKEPMLLDKTGELIVEALKSIAVREGATREVLAEMLEVMKEKLGGASGGVPELCFVPFTVTITAIEGDNLPKSTSCEFSGITFAEVEKAYADGKLLIADVSETTTGKRGFVPLTTVADSATLADYFFEDSGKNNLLGRPFCISIKNIKTANNQFVSCGIIRVRAEDVACSVTIGGTTHTTLAEALAALAGGAT